MPTIKTIGVVNVDHVETKILLGGPHEASRQPACRTSPSRPLEPSSSETEHVHCQRDTRMPGGTSRTLRTPPGHEQGHPQLMAVTQQEIENQLWGADDELCVAMPK